MKFLQAIETFLESIWGFLKIFAQGLQPSSGKSVAAVIIASVAGAMIAWLGARFFYLRRVRPRTAKDDPAAAGASAEKAGLSNEQYHLLFDYNPVPTFVCETRRWGCLEVNEAAVNGYGYSREEFLKIRFTDLSPAEEMERLSTTLVNLGASANDLGVWRHRKKDGTPIEIELVTFRVHFARRQARVLIARDVSSRRKIEDMLLKGVERLRLVSRATNDALLEWDLATDQVWRNDSYQRLFGYRSDELQPKMESWFEHVHADDRLRVQQRLLGVINSSQHLWNDEFRLTRHDQTIAHVHARGFVHRDNAGAALKMLGVLQDITARKESEERTRFLADHDELTGLPNRSLFKQSLAQAVQRAGRSGKFLSVLFLDLDRFKNINDSLGHETGDQVLRAVAQRLSGCVRQVDVVSRFGGDEFAVLIEGLTAEDQAGAVARKIVDALAKPLILAGRQYRPGASIGISTYPSDGRDVLSLQKNADIAMYRAKEEGRGTFKFYSEQLNTHSIQRLEFESNLNGALNNREFVLYYQPKVDLASGRIAGVEALIRWVSPQFGFVSPAEFIAIAEETGLIVPMGRWVVQTACVQNRAWQKGGLPPLRIAVNISARQMADKGLVDFIVDSMTRTGLTAESLELEITESAVMSNQDHAEKMLNQLKAIGFHLTMDDFGTGYSSLAYLKRFPFDSVKIDQSFVRGIPANRDDCAIVEAIIAMAHSLELKVVAEGVETQEQSEFLRKLGCDQIQGYVFSKPIPSAEIVGLLYKTMTRSATVQAGS
ncbi:MAG TPA: EAL domain-containing protein [Burkholderiales bacterium]|nr:EAL domain-containing protein [Burkholderiales bacterium]